MVVAFRDDGGDYIGLNSYFTAIDYAVIEYNMEYVDAIRRALAEFVQSYAEPYNGEFILNPASIADDSGTSYAAANRFVFEISDKRKSKRSGNGITYSGSWVNGRWEALHFPTQSSDPDIRREARKCMRIIDASLSEIFRDVFSE
jgi:hypothetical protein